MEIINLEIHKVNIKLNSITQVPHVNAGIDFKNYINEIIADVLKGEKSRKYKFVSDASEMLVLINRSVYENKFDESIKRSSEKLLTEEIKAQTYIARMGKEIQKGILIHAHINKDGKDLFIICKADDSPYIDEVNFKLSTGYPVKRKIFKSCLIEFNDDKSVFSVDIYDLTSASFWHSEYLSLEASLNDEENTTRAFEALDNAIFNPLKKDSLNDHWELRNSLITTMKTNPLFDINEYADEVLSKYKRTNEKLDMQKLVAKVKSLPQKHNFDNVFNLVSSAIKARTRRQIVPLTESIDLTIKEGLDTNGTIIPFLDTKDNTKYIAIKSDIGYDTFFKIEK